MKKLPGFRFDGKRKVAVFEVIVPGTGSKTRRRTTVEAETLPEALTKWKAFRREVLEGARTRPQLTFGAYVERFGPLRWARIVPRSVVRERGVLRRYLVPFFGEVPLPKVNAALVRDLVGKMKAEGRAPQTINGALSILRTYLRDAVDREELNAYPIRGRLPREKPVLLRLELAPDELRAFVRAFDDLEGFRRLAAEKRGMGRLLTSPHFGGPRVFGGGRKPDGEAVAFHFERFRASRPFFIVALETGLRQGDLLALRWSSVDLGAGWIRVLMQKTRNEAVIPISPACREALRELLARPVVGERVFLTEDGQPVSWTTLERYFRTAKKLAGIERRFRFHDVRHSFASRLASAGVSLQVIAKMLGHTSVQMSQRYARPDEEALRSAMRIAGMNAISNSAANSAADSPERLAALGARK